MELKNKLLAFTFFFALFGLLAPLAFIAKPVSAQSSNSTIILSISPPINYLSVKPGEEISYEIQVKNQSNLPLEITPSLRDFSPDQETGRPVLKNSSSFEYMEIDGKPSSVQQSFTLQPNQARNVPIRIDLPTSAPEVESSLTILFAFKPDSNYVLNQQSGAAVSGMVGSNLILLSTRNKSDRGQLSVTQISSYPFIDSFMPIKFKVTAENTGKNATPVNGFATIYNWRNKEIARFDIHPDMILAGSSRPLRESTFLSEVFRYKAPFHLGLYKIQVELKANTDEGAETTKLVKTVLAAPIIIFTLPVAGAMMYLVYRAILKRNKS